MKIKLRKTFDEDYSVQITEEKPRDGVVGVLHNMIFS